MTVELDRRGWMSLLAKAPMAELAPLWRALNMSPEFQWLRAPEVGATMVRGRMGGTGAPFNLGEMTITRCSLQLDDGVVGHGYVQGRDKEKARMAALVDALMQGEMADRVCRDVLVPLAGAFRDAKAERAAKAAATKVDFFTMVRGEDK
ncbi:phosphonate C-P lyase system protein PhnG [Shimia abyssi]|uniref:Alpha-D-ribose 1-methylphosphonate 5-triphosphate synthase subunit PhnG n=1 Tax=Shimia abyssi TaxID=1662395 RepID=A0A2P8F730_9RHOB|nr:phosphonate C-P lyase system protein PhnG [Shimia abyssi]PSL17519.1 alpha-D-ribose 1-methylphosphonate 5-triphosphate synthase subunit PhnG [Shimia abyssi]